MFFCSTFPPALFFGIFGILAARAKDFFQNKYDTRSDGDLPDCGARPVRLLHYKKLLTIPENEHMISVSSLPESRDKSLIV